MKTGIIIIALMATVACVNGGFMENIPNWISECIKQGQWKKETGQRIGTLSNLKAKDVACPMLCVAKQAGVISANGDINVDEMVKDLAESHKFDSNTHEQILSFANACAKKSKSDKGECAPMGELMDCLSALAKKP